MSSFTCTHPECHSKSFKRKGDLTRHQKLHEAQQRKFSCNARDCRKSFTRKDKLGDHIRAGHDEETVFTCPVPGCQVFLTKDTLSLHLGYKYARAFTYSDTNSYRQCPIPKCGFHLRLHRYGSPESIDALPRHIRDSHDIHVRKRFASLLANRGYHYETGSPFCPICPNANIFDSHTEFKEHVVDDHLGCFRIPNDSEPASKSYWYSPFYRYRMSDSGALWHKNADVRSGCRVYEAIPRILHEHRRTILSLWPDFAEYPVWEDITKCSNVHT